MKNLLLKAKASARAKEELKKAGLEGDNLAGQAEVVLFDAFEEGEGVVDSEKKSGRSVSCSDSFTLLSHFQWL